VRHAESSKLKPKKQRAAEHQNTAYIIRPHRMRSIYIYIRLILQTAVFFYSVNGDGSKTAKIIKKVILPTITLPECQRDAE